MRKFESKPAVREKTPLLVGLVGPSGTGKTMSALRLATGIQRITGGDIYGIDTEANRMLHYADKFKFHHVPFSPPFSPVDYLDAIEYCASKGAGVVIVDSQSLEHEGPGGVLDMHEQELDRLAGKENWSKRQAMNFLAWGKPKGQRRKLIQGILQLGINAIFCFRAKEKLKMQKGQEPLQLGWMPIAGEEFIYEMTLKCLLLPGCDGRPSWRSEFPGEQAMMKLPEQFRPIFAGNDSPQLSEDIGQRLAEWAAGAPAGPSKAIALSAKYDACRTQSDFDALESERKAAWSSLKAGEKTALKAASDTAKDRIARTTTEESADDEPFGVGPPERDSVTNPMPD